MRQELLDANRQLKRLLGREPTTFAYPCGQKFVGRGSQVKSYVPLVAELFLAGRGWLDEGANDPVFCDLAQVLGRELDGLDFAQVLPLLESAKQHGSWLVFCGHDVADSGRQTTLIATLDALCRHVSDPTQGFWTETVDRVASYIAETRRRNRARSKID
jgi:hypothetical protein